MATLKLYLFFFMYLFLRPHLFLLILKKVYLPVYIQYEWIKKIKKLLPFPNVILENIALSNTTGEATFYINSHSPSSSMLKVSENGEKMMTSLRKYKKITVSKTTLDKYFQNRKFDKFVVLKIDVQGTEHLILQGGRQVLKNIDLIHIETSFEKIYENQSLFAEIYKIMEDVNFQYFGSVKDSDFFPIFGLTLQENSIFINKKSINTLKKYI